MALTKVSTDGVKDDAITSGKIPANAVGTSELADNAVDTNAIANNAVTAGKTSGVQTTINNNGATRIITGSGNTNTLNGQSNAVIDSSGHMGLGVTPNTNLPSNGDFKFLQVGTGASLFGRGNGDEDRGGIAVNYYHDGSAEKYLANGNASGIKLNDGDIDFFTAPANSSGANAAMSKTVAMRIASTTGKVGIGTTSPASFLHLHESSSGSIEGLKITNSGTGSGLTDGLSIGLQSDEDVFIHNYENTAIHFGTNDTTRVSILAGGGLTFNGDTAAANALSDYEEGTFTPDWRGGQALGTTSYGTINSASYTKIGRMVTVTGRSEITGSSGGQGFWFLGNMPFNVNSGGKGFNAVGSVSLESTNFANDTTYVIATMEQNNNNMHIHTVRDNATLGTGVSPSNGAMTVQWTITYQTA